MIPSKNSQDSVASHLSDITLRKRYLFSFLSPVRRYDIERIYNCRNSKKTFLNLIEPRDVGHTSSVFPINSRAFCPQICEPHKKLFFRSRNYMTLSPPEIDWLCARAQFSANIPTSACSFTSVECHLTFPWTMSGIDRHLSSLWSSRRHCAFVLLPQGVFDLFSVIRARNWYSEKMVALIFHKLLWPAAFQCVCNPLTCQQYPALKSLLEEISTTPS
jgi:hypothetical protein